MNPTLSRFEVVEFLDRDEEWTAMRRVIGRLVAKGYASSVYAGTSMMTLCLSLSPERDQTRGASLVAVTPSEAGLFRVEYFGPRDRRFVRLVCQEAEAERLVDALVLRLDLTRDER
jgi:hypothetical protein